jgi:putative FmdB family regulatory protein
MPIYEYVCQDCGKQFETIVASSLDTSAVPCKYCGSKQTKKTISATSFRISSSSGSVPFGSGSGGGCSSGSGFS